MQGLLKTLGLLFLYFAIGTNIAFANQTNELSPILSANNLPFTITIERANFQLPQGNHSGLFGVYQGQWILIAGRTGGLHGFGPDPFPIAEQNKVVYVINPSTGAVVSRSLTDPSSGLSQQQIDSLSVVSPQGFQDGNTLYMSGGYGIDTATNTFTTKPVFTAINLPGIVKWVTHPTNRNFSVVKNIRQIYNPIFQIAGGEMSKAGNLIQIAFGQNFTGVYTPGSNGDYSQQVRLFKIKNVRGQLAVDIFTSKPQNPDPNYRRRDLNILPVLRNNNNLLQYGVVAYGGVFTLDGGVWTVPVVVDSTGNPSMADPVLASTFKQGMNHYVTAAANLYSKNNSNMYNILLGGMSYGFYSGGTFQTDTEIPFINQVTTIKMDRNGSFTQYIMANEYPEILSTTVNPGNTLLFGAGAYFIPNNISQYSYGIINLDNIRQPTIIGYIVGGITSTLPNTNTDADSFASTYIFKVTLTPQ